jgi:hypothetical protein
MEPEDSDSLPIPDSLPKLPNDGLLGGSAGRATGRPPPVKDAAGFGAAGMAGRGAGLAAALGAAARGVLFLALERFFAVVRLGAAFLAAGRLAVLRLTVERFAVDFFLLPDRDAVDRLAGAFFLVEDFFFAGIFPPFGCATQTRAGFMRMRIRGCYLRFIASVLRKDKHFAPPSEINSR